MATVTMPGSGCSKCKALEQRLLSLKATHTLAFDSVKVTDLDEITSRGIMMTSGLVINRELESVGGVPGEAPLLEWLGNYSH